jgi:hypothetical protein
VDRPYLTTKCGIWAINTKIFPHHSLCVNITSALGVWALEQASQGRSFCEVRGSLFLCSHRSFLSATLQVLFSFPLFFSPIILEISLSPGLQVHALRRTHAPSAHARFDFFES